MRRATGIWMEVELRPGRAKQGRSGSPSTRDPCGAEVSSQSMQKMRGQGREQKTGSVVSYCRMDEGA